MIVDLTDDEVKMINEWYGVASNESYTTPSDELFILLEKLDIQPESSDLMMPSLHVKKEHRERFEKQRAAILAYKERHPEVKAR